MTLFLQLLANGMVNGAVYAMLAVGFGLVWRSLGIFHVAYGGLFVLCAYCFYVLVVHAGFNLYLSLALTLVFAACAGWLTEIVLYRPFQRKNASSAAVLIASLGILIVIENVIAMVFGNESLNIPRNNAWSVNLGPITLSDMQILPFAIGFIIVAILWVSVRRLRIFRALWAIGDQPELISALGLPLFFLRGLALMLSTILTAIPASLLCLDGRADPHIGMEYLLIAAVAVLVGGMNSYVGWVSGAVALAVLKSLVVWKFSSQWTDLVTFTLLVGILLFRPRGLLESTKRIEDAL